MSTTVLARLCGQSFSSNQGLSAIQSQTDTSVGRFVEEAANWKTLAAISTGSLLYRYGRLATLGLAGEATSAAPVVRIASMEWVSVRKSPLSK
jgi:hypothetical protein